MVILIPSYQPTDKMIHLVRGLTEKGINHIVIVNDGSDSSYGHLFTKAEEYGCRVITHSVNRGKGRALKTGLQYIKELGLDEIIICADNDGQHSIEDILKVSEASKEYPDHILLGSRAFVGKVPLKSRLGNAVTRWIFNSFSGLRVRDTQTGLRAFSPKHIEWLLGVPGDCFEYEMNMLLEIASKKIPLHEVPIETIYMGNDRSTHFRAVTDSIRVMLPLFKYALRWTGKSDSHK